MSRFVKWITLTPEERRHVQPVHLAYQSGQEGGSGLRRSPLLKEHSCSVTMPDGSSCLVRYTRYGPRAHDFAFDPPIRQTLYIMTPLDNSANGIEAQAQTLATSAFERAQQEERKTMRRATAPPGYRNAASFSEASRIKPKTAQELAGRYAVCLRFASGRLLSLGTAYEKPEGACMEITKGRHASVQLARGQHLVIGIFCRWRRCWQQALFVVCPALTTPAESADPSPPAEVPSSPLSPACSQRKGVSEAALHDELMAESDAWGREADEEDVSEDREAEEEAGAASCAEEA